MSRHATPFSMIRGSDGLSSVAVADSALLQDVAGQKIKIKLRRYPQMSAIIQDCVNQSRLTHANFRRCRPGNMVWRIVPVNTIRGWAVAAVYCLLTISAPHHHAGCGP